VSLASVDSASRRMLLSSLGAVLFILSLAGIDFITSGALDLRALVPPFGASTVIVFFSPESPTGRPWNILVGHLGSAMVATMTLMLLPTFPLGVQAAMAVAGAGVWMVLSKSIHPPGGATALLTTLAGLKPAMLGWNLSLFAGCVSLVSVSALLNLVVRKWDLAQTALEPDEALTDPSPVRDS
jgi:CBS-domain-containing membrane protein